MNSDSRPATNGYSGVDRNDTKLYEPIAIIGMGMRLPGGVRNTADYWDLLVNGKDGRCRVPKSRYNVDTWYGPGSSQVPSEFGYFLEELNLAHVDPSFWSFTKQEAELMDPRQRLFLEVAYEALENSGSRNWRGTDVGVYVGTMGEDWNLLEYRDEQSLQQVRPDVYGDYIIANRASYEFDITGPSMVVRTACSSSLVALHLACRDLQNGDCTSALVGGANLILTPKDTVIMHQQGVLSPSASCKSFDADADGFARGEGVSAIYIKRLADAVRDGDPIRAVIRSTCVAGNGRTPGLTTPSPEIHERLMRRGHKLAGITDLSKTAMVECHGTGTSVGDPLEVSAVANIWGDHGIYIGSVKPNIGHGEGASGLSSIIKMVLALENSTIPPNINFKTPNPKIPWTEAKLTVPTEPLPWPADRLERVSVNSFGIGGSNAHVLLESAACFLPPSDNIANGLKPGTSKNRILTFSARHPDSVKASISEVESYLARYPERLSDVSYSLASRRETHTHRAFCLSDGSGAFQMSSISKPTITPSSMIWVFTGQGAQWAQMGKELLEHEPLFQQQINALDHVLAGLPDPPPWTLKDLLLASKEESRLSEAEFSQPCLVAVQVALVCLLRLWGVVPTAVVGHSSGETAAAYASGAITAEEAIIIAYHRGQITRIIKAAHNGSMAAVGLGRKQIEEFLRPGVIIGCENSPSNVTLSGESDVLQEILYEIRSKHPEVLARSLHVECGYHSDHMKSAAADFASRLEGLIQNKEPSVPFYSSVTGKRNTDLSPSYWVKNVVSPVLFNTAVQAVLEDFKSPLFVEIGPHSALAGPIRQILHYRNRTAQYIPTLVRNQDAVSAVLKTAGELWLAGNQIDISAVVPAGEFLTDLPTYAWHYEEEYWMESRLSRSWRFRKFKHHELLGSRVEAISDACPAWRCNLRLEDVPWLREHVIHGEKVFPASGYISMVGEALRQLKGSLDFTLSHITLESALVLNDEQVELVTILNPAKLKSSDETVWYDFTVSSLNKGSQFWFKHVFGQCRAGPDQQQLVPEIAPLPRKVSMASFYNTWKRFGLSYGNLFRNIVEVSSHVTEAKATATLESKLSMYDQSVYSIHPATLDSSMHVAMISACRGLERNYRELTVPTYIHEVYVGKPSEGIQVVATADTKDRVGVTSNIIGVSAGRTVIDIRGLRVIPLDDDSEGSAEDTHAGAILEWKPDIDFFNYSQLFHRRRVDASARVLEELVLVCIVDLRAQLQFLPAMQPHLVRLKSWLDASYREAMTGQYPEVLNSFEIASMSQKSRQEAVSRLLESCKDTAAKELAAAVHQVHTFGAGYFSGSPHAAKALMQDSHLDGVRKLITDVDFSHLIRLLGHKKPSMSILHIGPTPDDDSISSSLFSSKYEDRPYGSYVYTGTSATPPKLTEKRLGSQPSVNYSQLMIEIDPVFQGFTEESFDLIISEPTLSSFSMTAISNMRKLLKPRGRLILQYLNPASRVLQFALGLSPEFNLGFESPIKQETLCEQLNRAGFDGASAFTYTGEHGRLTIAAPYMGYSRPKNASVICQDPNHSLVADAVTTLQSRGFGLQFFCPGQDLPWGQPVVCLLDLESPFLHEMTQSQWEELKNSLSSAQDEKMLWVTGASQVNCKDPRYSLTLGFTRSIRRELSMDLATLELESFDASGWNASADLFESLCRRNNGGEVDPDAEYVFSNGSIQICRFHSIKVLDELQDRYEEAPKTLKICEPGGLQGLRWKQYEPIPVNGDFVEIEVKAVGLHDADLRILMANPSSANNNTGGFGLEGSGVVRAIGPEARRFRVGDRVAFNNDSCLSTVITLPETLCAEIPENMSFEEAASTPYSYGTVLYGLMELGRLKKGQSILIHSACDALGLAAVQVAKFVGAEIFCTVENPEQAQYLTISYGMPKYRILNYKNASFLPDILQLTNKLGVDIVFNTGPSRFIQSSWKCVAPFGIMIQVGRGDSLAAYQIQMDKFSRNRTFIGLDLEDLRVHRPLQCTRLLEQAFTWCKFGLNEPSQPTTSFPASNAASAFQHLQAEERIGRVVVTFPHDDSKSEELPLRSEIALRSDRTYVIVGGLGGLGQATARFLVERGARHLVFFSRSAEDYAKSHPEFFSELQFLDCKVHAISGSVNDMNDVVKMIDSVTTPVAGILQAAMVLQDVHFVDMTFDQWRTTVYPKVQGTWNLHHALQAQREPLDFFFLFSSLSGLGGQIGQVNYAAGNAFLDAFVQYRHSEGLACSVLDIGIMEDIGVLARETNRLEALRATSQHCLHEQDLLDSLELMIWRSHENLKNKIGWQVSPFEGYTNHSQVAIGMRSSSTANRTGWQRDPRAGFLSNKTVQQVSDHGHKMDKTLKDYLQSCSLDPAVLASDEAREFLAREISAALRGFTMQQDEEVDILLPLQTDSLVTVELRNWLRQKVGVVFNILEMRRAESILALGGMAAARLSVVYRAGMQDLAV